MARRRNLKKETVLEAIEGSWGVVSTIAKSLKVTWITADRYVKKWKDTQEAWMDECQKRTDIAETGIMEIMKDKNHKDRLGACKYHLSTQGKKRGYTTSTELTTGDGGFNIIIREKVSEINDNEDS